MKLLKRKILFSLASETDFFFKPEGFEYKAYGFLYWRLADYQPSSIRDAILQLVESGEVDKIIRNGLPLFRLTSKGRDRLLSFFTISTGQKKVWDRIWRIALVRSSSRISSKSKKRKSKKEVKEKLKELRKLRQGLRKLGFKKLSPGVYITPLPISEKLRDFLLKESFSAQVAVIESRKLLMADDEQLAKQIWSLNSLLEKYNQFIRRVNKLLKNLKTEKRLLKKEKKQFSLILSDFFSLLEADPGLPKKLLPDDWPLDLAKIRFLKLVERVKFLENEAGRV